MESAKSRMINVVRLKNPNPFNHMNIFYLYNFDSQHQVVEKKVKLSYISYT